jgi:O-antigen/teichoic acid export membrane protein
MQTHANSDAPVFENRVRHAVFWRSGSQIVSQILMWTVTLIVVRLLDPSDYGLFALSEVVFIALNFLNAQSFASSLIHEEHLPEERIGQVFGVLLLFNFGLGLLHLASAPFVAEYFNQPLLQEMLIVQTVIYLVTPFIALPNALLARKLDFKSQAKSDLIGAFAGAAIALTGAYNGFGVWTLVCAPIGQQLVRAFCLGIFFGGIVRPRFSLKGMGTIFSFGSALIVCQFFWVIQSKADTVIAGGLFNTHELGLYNEALFITLIFTAKFIPPLNEVAFPAYTQHARSGGDVGKAFLMTARMLMFASIPFYLGLSAVADPFVRSVLGDKWVESIPLIAGLALAMPFFALQIICSPTTNALGKPRIYVFSSAAGAAVFTACFYYGAQYGVTGLVSAWHIAAPVLLAITLGLTLPVIKVSAIDLGRAILPSAFAGIAMYAVVTYLQTVIVGVSPLVKLLLLVPAGGVVYLGLIWIFARELIEDLYQFITKKELGKATVVTQATE